MSQELSHPPEQTAAQDTAAPAQDTAADGVAGTPGSEAAPEPGNDNERQSRNEPKAAEGAAPGEQIEPGQAQPEERAGGPQPDSAPGIAPIPTAHGAPDGASEPAEAAVTAEAPAETAQAAESEARAEAASGSEPEPGPETEAESQSDALPKGSIAAVGERLGQRVAQAGEAAGDKVAHMGEVAAQRVAHAVETAGERVAHAGEAAGQRVILAGEAAEGTVADAQTRAMRAKNRLASQAGALARRLRHSAPPAVRETGTRAVDAVKKHPREAAVGSALVGLAAAARRKVKRSHRGD